MPHCMMLVIMSEVSAIQDVIKEHSPSFAVHRGYHHILRQSHHIMKHIHHSTGKLP